jgi:hypothetical protein
MKNFDFKKALPHVIAVIVFLIVAIVYCLPALKGLVVNQSDMTQVAGMMQDSKEYFAQHGSYPLWNNSMFGGMPAYQIYLGGKSYPSLTYLHQFLTAFLPYPAGLFFLACISFYILSQVLKAKPWVGILGALAYGYASYNAIIMEVGHITKFATMGYAPMVLAGLLLLSNKNYVWGSLLTLISTTLLFTQNHAQMVYYLFIVILCFGVAFLYQSIKEKQLMHFGKTIGLAVMASAIAIMAYAGILLPTNEYSKETMRGGRSELTLDKEKDSKKNKTEGGLDKDYAFMWSYGKMETFTMMLPNFNGGASGPQAFGENSKSIEALQESGLPNDAINQFYGAFSAYWGDQPGTSGPVYFGAIICMLFLASFFFVDKKYLWWLVAATAIGIILSWGQNLKGVNYFLFDYLPFYKKFRAPSSSLVIPQLTMVALATLALQSIFYGNWDNSILRKKLKGAGIATLSVVVILALVYFSSSFKGEGDKRFKESVSSSLTNAYSQGQPAKPEAQVKANEVTASFTKALVQDRKSLYMGDFLRMLAILIIGGGIVFFTATKKLSATIGTILLTALCFFDVITVCNRYLNKDNYVEQSDYEGVMDATAIDNQIKQDKSFYRVFNQAGGDPFQEAKTSYHHNSLGGYSPVKLGLYQDLITHQLSKGNMPTYNMLNAKYFIVQNPQNGQPMIQQNPGALGNAWFVKNIKFVNNANEEMLALDSLDAKNVALVDVREKSKVTTTPAVDTAASITLVKNDNDEIEYKSSSTSNQFAVLSEIYYPYGWKAFVDGKETTIARVNYALRGINVPSGNHTIKFEFKPQSVKTGETLRLWNSILSFLAVAICLFLLFKQSQKKD